MIYLAADHGGFELKTHLIDHLTSKEVPFEDVGAFELDENDDYPDLAIKACSKVAQNPTQNKAILACRSGSGETIVANKFKHLRATVSWDIGHAKKSREHNDCNILALPADYVSVAEALKIADVWLTTEYFGEERHARRLGKIADLEELNFAQKEEVASIL